MVQTWWHLRLVKRMDLLLINVLCLIIKDHLSGLQGLDIIGDKRKRFLLKISLWIPVGSILLLKLTEFKRAELKLTSVLIFNIPCQQYEVEESRSTVGFRWAQTTAFTDIFRTFYSISWQCCNENFVLQVQSGLCDMALLIKKK